MDPDEIQIFIKGIDGRTITIDIHKDAKVERIYELLSEKIGIPVEGNRLLYCSKELESHKFLIDYGIEKRSTLYHVSRLRGGSQRIREKVLDHTVELSDAPDMITWDDDPENKRVKMPCGHAITPESLTQYCSSLLKEGKWRFFCPHITRDQPAKYCNQEWDYLQIRRLAALTEDEKEEFEDKIAKNHLFKGLGIQECPKCKSMVERKDKKDVQLRCTVCSEKDGKTYEFCWHCLKEWYNQNSRTQCGNADCSGEDKRLKALRECPRKKIGVVEGCPCYRACIFCGSLIEHTEACKHMHCRCGKDFCFVCLKPRDNNGWKCGGSGDSCLVAPVQTMIPGV